MKLNRVVAVTLSVLILVSTACGLPGAAASVEKTAAPTTGVTATVLPTAVVSSGPLDLVQLYEARLKAGDWTEGQGLAQLLGMYTGSTQSGDPAGNYTLQDDELTGLLRMADRYLTANPQDQYHDEVQKQVNLLVAPVDKLDNFSKKHSLTAVNHLDRLRVSPKPDAATCQELWADGFSSTTPVDCFEFDEHMVAGTRLRLYYPSWWPAGDPRLLRLAPLLQGATRAIQKFNTYGPRPLPPVTMVVTELLGMDPKTHTRSSNIHALAIRGRTPSPSCYVGLFPSLVGPGITPEQSQQAVAHEMFHCYQYQNLSDQERNPAGDAAEWWVEGSADYFSNVVYPSVNFEQRDMDILFNDVLNRNMLEWSYKSYIFFQYLENRPDFGGERGILNLLGSLPITEGSGIDQQMANLSAYPNMGVIFQEFAQAMADGNILDTDHNPVPLDPPVDPGTVTEPTSAPSNFGRDPFAISIHRVLFPHGFNYDLTMSTHGDPGRSSARLESAPRSWGALPNPVESGCNDLGYLVVVTQTGATQDNDYNFRLAATARPAVTAGICDCLPGSWLMDDSTYLTHLNGLIAQSAPGTVDYTGVSGSDVVTFTQDGQVNQDLRQLVIDGKGHVPGLADQSLRISMDGTSSASFTAAEGILTFTGYESNLTILTELNGSPLSTPNNALAGGPLGTAAAFVCSGDTLTLTPKYPNYSSLPPLTFTRQP